MKHKYMTPDTTWLLLDTALPLATSNMDIDTSTEEPPSEAESRDFLPMQDFPFADLPF